jgi:hypothetical protein
MLKGQIAPVTISVIVLVGFSVFSFLAKKPELAGVKESVVLFLLGAWSTMAAGVVNYWVGSSSSSKQKDDTIQTMTSTAGTTASTAATTANTAATVEAGRNP